MPGAVHAEKERVDRRKLIEVAAPVARTPTLTVGHAFDPAEAEADRVADSVLARLRGGDGGETHEHSAGCDHDVQRSSTPSPTAEVGMAGGELSADLSTQIESRRGRGSALPSGVRRRMESAFGRDLGDVSIHTDDKAARLSSAVAARAFTTGKDVFFGAGQFRPDTPSGERMLAHELAHTQQRSGSVGRKAIHRYWDFHGPRIDWSRATAMRTFKSRCVWFLTDSEGDDIVVKMENQPIGLSQLAAEMHGSFGTAASVLQRKLDDQDRAAVAALIDDAGVAKGQTWADFANFMKWPVPELGPLTPANAEAQGRKMAVGELRKPSIHHNLLAMTLASGKAAEDAAKPDHGGKGFDPLVSLFRVRLDNDKHAQQLGEIAAVDLFLGNTDRVTAGNMGNWFYNSNGAVTLIDHVDQGSGQAAAYVNNGGDWASDAGAMLKNPEATATKAVNAMAGVAKNKGDAGFETWLDEKQGGQTRRARIEANLVAGMKLQIKRLKKVFTATRYTIGGKKDRAQKKEMKAQARAATATDTGDRHIQGGTPNYYEIMKQRAKTL